MRVMHMAQDVGVSLHDKALGFNSCFIMQRDPHTECHKCQTICSSARMLTLSTGGCAFLFRRQGKKTGKSIHLPQFEHSLLPFKPPFHTGAVGAKLLLRFIAPETASSLDPPIVYTTRYWEEVSHLLLYYLYIIIGSPKGSQ